MIDTTILVNAFESLRKREGDYLPLIKLIFFESLKKKYPTKKLSELLIDSKGGSWGNFQFKDSIKAKVLRSPDIRFGFIDFENAEERFFTEKEIQNFNLTNDDILVIKSNGSLDLVGKSQIFKSNKNYPNIIASNFLMVLTPDTKKVYPEYLDLFLKSPQSLIWRFDKQKTSTGLRNLKSSEYLKNEIPIPNTIEEQKELFNIFQKYVEGKFENKNDVFERAFKITNEKEEIISQLTTQQTLITQLRQSILQEAVQGKLTAEFRSSHPELVEGSHHASELLKRIKAEKEKLIKQKKLKAGKSTGSSKSFKEEYYIPENWTWCKTDDILFITKLAGFEYTEHINLKENGEIPVVRAQNVRPLEIDKTNLLYIDRKTSLLLNRCSLTKKCLLVTFIGAGIGDVATFDEKERWHLAPNVAKMEPFEGCEELVNIKFINYFLMSDIGQKEIFKHVQATAQPSLSMGTIRDIDIPLPPLPEQKRIVEKVNQLMQHCNELEQQVQQSITHAQQLMQAVLREVFESRKEYKINEQVGMAAES